jgi:WD40 repeat protein/tetratricopeptide (TPR) repeat protein
MSDRESRLDAAIAEYYLALEAGTPPERGVFLARYPDLAGDLAVFLDDKAAFERRAGRVPPPSEQATIGIDEPRPALLGVVRYFGDYELLEELARGGMGVVFKARQVSLNRIVALKMILAGQLAAPADVERFRKEAEAAASLDHPNILPIHEVGEHEGQRYFSMKLVTGGSLADRIAELRGNPREAAGLLATVARAVHHAHQRGVLHRDLKPGNVLLDADGRPYVTDFGLARPIEGDSGLTRSGSIVGTPSYMPPEQARAEKRLTTAVDVYGLGAILYQCLTGQPPFRGPSVMDTVLAVLDREPVRPRDLASGLDRDLEVICLKCLEKDPARRYGSALALAEDLERWLRGEPILARPAGTRERVVKWARRRPAVAALLALLAVVTQVGFVAVLVLWLEADRARRAEADRADSEREAREDADEARRGEARRADAERRARADAERSLYFQQIALAQQEWAAGNVRPMRALLDACPPAHRGWEWGFLRQLGRGDLRTLSTGRTVKCLAFHPGGRFLVAGGTAGGNDTTIWDLETGKERLRIPDQGGYVTRVAVSPDGRFLAVAWRAPGPGAVMALLKGKTPTGRVSLFEPLTGKKLRELTGAGETVHDLAFSPDGQTLAAACDDGKVRFWGPATGRAGRVLAGHQEKPRALAFSPDGRRLVTVSAGLAGGGELKVWDVQTGKEVFAVEDAGGNAVAWSPDGALLAVAGVTRTVRLFDAARGKLRHTLAGHADAVHDVAFSPDGRVLASAGADRTVRLWGPAAGTALGILRGHAGAVQQVAFAPDGRLLATAGRVEFEGPDNRGEVKLWDATREDSDAVVLRYPDLPTPAKGPTQEMFGWLSTVLPHGLRFAAGGAAVQAASANGSTVTWDARTGRLTGLTDAVGLSLTSAFSRDGRLLAVVRFLIRAEDLPRGDVPDKEAALAQAAMGMLLRGSLADLALLDGATGKPTRQLEEPGVASGRVAFSGDGRWLAGGAGRLAKVWDTRTGKLRLRLEGPAPIHHVALSPDGRWLAAGHKLRKAGQVVLWDLSTGKQHLALPDGLGADRPLEFSADGRWLLAPGAGPALVLVDVAAGQVRHTLTGHTLPSGVGTFSPDGRLVATGGWDSAVRLWDVASGRLLHLLRGHTRAVQALAFSPDGRRLASSPTSLLGVLKGGREPGEVKVWDVDTGREMLRLDGMGQVAFSPDGRRLVSGAPGYTYRVWDAEPPDPVRQERRRRDWEAGAETWHRLQQALANHESRPFARAFHLGRLLVHKPEDAWLLGECGKSFRELGEHARARHHFDALLRRQPEAGAVWYARRGWEALELGDADRALADLYEAVGRGMTDDFTYLLRGRAHLHRHDWPRAVADLTVALGKGPGAAGAWIDRAQAQAERGRWREAEADLTRGLALKGDAVEWWDRLACVRLAAAGAAGYQREVQVMLRRFPTVADPEDAHTLAFACVRVPGLVIDPLRLVALALRATESRKDTDRAEAEMLLGAVLLRLGQPAAALPHLLQAEKLRGQKASAVDALFLALVYQALGQTDRAREALGRGVRLTEVGVRKRELDWRQRLNRAVLRREAEAALGM